jgi:hypothetical protein
MWAARLLRTLKSNLAQSGGDETLVPGEPAMLNLTSATFHQH